MNQVKLTFLGTGTSQGVPVIGCNCTICASEDLKDKRLRTSVFIEVNGLFFVVDTGPDFRQQMLREKINKIDAVLFTHEHKDHIAGLDDIRAFNFLMQKPIDVYASVAVQQALKREYQYIFSDYRYPGIPQINLQLLENTVFKIDSLTITPILVWHYKLPVFGFRIGDLVYITDANKIDDVELKKMQGCKVLIVNALRKEAHISHFTLQEAINLAFQVGAERTYFTHISHQLGCHNLVEAELPKGMFLAFDGLKVATLI